MPGNIAGTVASTMAGTVAITMAGTIAATMAWPVAVAVHARGCAAPIVSPGGTH
jgi:hypothetical protein